MSLHKYMSAADLLRFLSNWELRLTPGFVFNDPFELRSPFPPLDEAVAQLTKDRESIDRQKNVRTQLVMSDFVKTILRIYKIKFRFL